MKDQIINWLKFEVNNANAKGVVFGISGGIDSAVVAHLVKEAFPQNSLALWIDIESSSIAKRNACKVIEDTQLKSKSINLTEDYRSLLKSMFEIRNTNEIKNSFDKHIETIEIPIDKSYLNNENFDLAKENLKSRLRMISLYSHAQLNNYLVIGTSNKSEFTVGYFTKWGDFSVDLQPILNLTKKKVYNLGVELNVNKKVLEAIPSADLYEGQSDEEDLGVKYSDIESYINDAEMDIDIKEKITKMKEKSEHKKRFPKSFIIKEN